MAESTAVQPRPRGFDLTAWLPNRRALLWVPGAFVLGLLLFAVVWKRDSNDDFYRAGPPVPGEAGPRYAPLPAPVAAGDGTASEIAPPSSKDSGSDHARLVETAPPPPPALPVATAAPAPASAPTAKAPMPSAMTLPEPISSPAPEYPARSLRRGDQGTVMVSAQIGPNGVPTRVEVARTSGFRALDRAALDAVRRWRFRPAMANGQPTSGQVQIPIVFSN